MTGRSERCSCWFLGNFALRPFPHKVPVVLAFLVPGSFKVLAGRRTDREGDPSLNKEPGLAGCDIRFPAEETVPCWDPIPTTVIIDKTHCPLGLLCLANQ